MDLNNNLFQIEYELKKRLAYPYKWGQKQHDLFDNQTNFIYSIPSFEVLLNEINSRFKNKNEYNQFFNYSLNRWYNFWSAQAVEKIFCSLPDVIPAQDKKDHLVDFIIHGVNFDHKTSVFPRNYKRTLKETIVNTDELIRWLYENQSGEKRRHYKNRLFVVLYSTTGEHWKLKSEISFLKKEIEHYMIGFNPDFLFRFDLGDSSHALADVIWIIK